MTVDTHSSLTPAVFGKYRVNGSTLTAVVQIGKDCETHVITTY